MSDFVQQILNQLTVPPGDLIYYIVLVFVVMGAFQSALNHWRTSEFPQAKRAYTGLGVLLAAQLIMFFMSGLGWQEIVDPLTVLPPMDRAFLVFSIIWITWLYAFPEPNRQADASAIILSMFIVTAMGLSLLSWQRQAVPTLDAISYNLSLDDFIWQIGSLLFAIFGITVLSIRKPDGRWYGILLLSIGALGHIGQLWLGLKGDFSGIVRLAYMAAFPILLTLPQRFSDGKPVTSSPLPSKPATYKIDTAGRTERRRYSTDPKTFHTLLAVAAENNSTKMSQALTRAIGQTMLADLCFMIYLTDNNNQMQIAGGYDLIREDGLDGGSLTKNAIPMLANSIQRGRALRLPASSTSADIKGLGDILGLTNPGHLLYVPILTPEKETLGGVLLLSPYSDRTWSAEDQAFLANITASLVPIIQRNQKINKLEAQSDMARLQMSDLEERVKLLTQQLGEARTEVEKANTADISSMRAAQEESQNIIAQLQRENSELRAGKNLPSTQAENELRATLQEMVILQSNLAQANMKILDLEKGQASAKSTEQAEVIASISQELRQPLSSIVGYTDLLLGESVGILGVVQKKFVDRIKASTERIRNLTDDMIRITTLATDLNQLSPETVDINTVIDNAMSYTSSQLREKNISIHLELPKSLTTVQVNREALQQILIHLLQNAGAATPFEGTIKLKVLTGIENGTEYVQLQVTDQGGGIDPSDLSRVFTRLYRAENVLIQGVGDTGVGLSIAKSLAESQHGKIWVESEFGKGSTFSVLLPITGDYSAGGQRN